MNTTLFCTVLVSSIFVSRCAMAADAKDDNAHETQIELASGDYAFVGMDTGQKKKSESSAGIAPRAEVKMSGTAKSVQWYLRVSSVVTSDSHRWICRADVYSKDKDGYKFQGGQRWEQAIPTSGNVVVFTPSSLHLRKVDATDAKIQHPSEFTFRIGEVDGEPIQLLILVDTDPATIEKAVKIPSVNVAFRWDSIWLDYP